MELIGMNTEEWDKREEIRERICDFFTRSNELLPKYVAFVEEYAEINKIELHSREKDYDDYLVIVYGFVWDAKFIDFAYDKSGIIFSKDIYELDEECSNELERLCAFEDTD